MEIDDKIILETYAFHGKEGIKGLISVIENGIFDFIDSQEAQVYEDITNKLKGKEKDDTTEMEDRPNII